MVAGGVKFQIRMDGFIPLKAKLQQNALIAEPWRNAMQAIADLAGTSARAAAPIRTGDLENSIRSWADRKPVPLYAVVKVYSRHGGFPYPRALEYYPFANNRYKKGENRHLGWMTQSLERIRGLISGLMDQAADAIEQRWAA